VGGCCVLNRWTWRMAQVQMLVWQLPNVWGTKFILLSQRTCMITFWCYPMALFCFRNHDVQKWLVIEETTLVYKTTSYKFINYFKPKLQHFVKCKFVAQWEDKQFKQSIKSFPTNIVVSIVAFVKNYTFKIQNEVKVSTGIITKFLYWCILVSITTLSQIHMMRFLKF